MKEGFCDFESGLSNRSGLCFPSMKYREVDNKRAVQRYEPFFVSVSSFSFYVLSVWKQKNHTGNQGLCLGKRDKVEVCRLTEYFFH